MGNIFYFFGLIIVIFNLFTIYRFKRIFTLREWVIKFKEVTGKDPISSDYRKKDDKDMLITWSVSVILTSFWIFFGLLSKSWYIFLSIIIINTVINLINKLIGEFSVFSFALNFIKSLAILLVIIFLILNHFHLHIDIWKLISNHF
jgi:hypothetical protein